MFLNDQDINNTALTMPTYLGEVPRWRGRSRVNWLEEGGTQVAAARGEGTFGFIMDDALEWIS